jgi:hypothetical protein
MRLIKAEDVLLGVERLLEQTSRETAPGADPYLPQSIVV